MNSTDRTGTRVLGGASAVVLALAMTACTYDSADLRAYVAEVKSRPGGPIDKIPPLPPPPEIPEVSKAADPFASFLAEELENVAKPIHPEHPPWPPRNEEELERFALDSLRMVGTLRQQDEQWGLVRDPDGVVHRVRAGNFMGRNHGKILEVSDSRIVLMEKVSNLKGDWDERDAEIALSN